MSIYEVAYLSLYRSPKRRKIEVLGGDLVQSQPQPSPIRLITALPPPFSVLFISPTPGHPTSPGRAHTKITATMGTLYYHLIGTFPTNSSILWQ
jgi:hypothetical protein